MVGGENPGGTDLIAGGKEAQEGNTVLRHGQKTSRLSPGSPSPGSPRFPRFRPQVPTPSSNQPLFIGFGVVVLTFKVERRKRERTRNEEKRMFDAFIHRYRIWSSLSGGSGIN